MRVFLVLQPELWNKITQEDPAVQLDPSARGMAVSCGGTGRVLVTIEQAQPLLGRSYHPKPDSTAVSFSSALFKEMRLQIQKQEVGH